MGAMLGTTLSDRAAVSNEDMKVDMGAVSGLNMIAARLRPGAISESSSSHLPPSEASLVAKPVTFPLGRSSRATTLLATGSLTFTKTIGIVRISRWTAVVAAVSLVRMMSGCEPTNSCASARIRLMSEPVQRRSIRTLRPSVHPKSASAFVNAKTRGLNMGSFSSLDMRTPMRRTRSRSCARATSGHAAALLSPAMNCRRRICVSSADRGGSLTWSASPGNHFHRRKRGQEAA
jgi:hypothetical protein